MHAWLTAIPVADPTDRPWPTAAEAVTQLRACGLTEDEVAAYLRVRVEVTDGLRARVAEAVN